MLSIRGKKFKRRSDFQSESSLNQILEQRSRISVNGSTHGKVEIKVSTNAVNVLNRSSYNRCVAINKRLQYEVQVNHFEAKPRGSLSAASNQMNENKESCDSEAQRSSKRKELMNQSEFDNIEDYIDEQEECGSEQKAIRFSIRCLDFQMMMPAPNEQQPMLMQQFEQTLTDKQDHLLFHGQEGRHSLLSRASSLMMSSSIKKQFNLTSNQALPLQLSLFPVSMNALLQQKQICTPQNSNTIKILPDSKKSVRNTSSSQINMTNIDEKEELQSVTQKNAAQEACKSQHAVSPAVAEASRVAHVHQCSNLSNYNMQTFFTPSQASKKNVHKNFESLSASCNVFDKQRGQSAAAPRPQSNVKNDKEGKINSPGGSVLHDYTAKLMQARSKSQN